MLIMELFVVPISTVNIYLSNDAIQVRCHVALASGKKDEREKRMEMGKRVTVNKWQTYLFGEKANLCTGQNTDSMPEPRCQSEKDSPPFPRFCLFLRTFLSFKIKTSNQASDVSLRLIYTMNFAQSSIQLFHKISFTYLMREIYSLSKLITRGLVIHF